MEHDSFDGVCMLGAMCCATGVGTLRAVGARWMAATVEQSDVSAWRVAKRFRRPASTTERLVGYTRGRTRDTAWAGVRATQCRSVSHRCPSLSCALWKSARAKRNPAIFVTLAGGSIVIPPTATGRGRRRATPTAPRPTAHPHAAYKIIAPIRYNEKPITVPYRIRLSVPSDT